QLFLGGVDVERFHLALAAYVDAFARLDQYLRGVRRAGGQFLHRPACNLVRLALAINGIHRPDLGRLQVVCPARAGRISENGLWRKYDLLADFTQVLFGLEVEGSTA